MQGLHVPLAKWIDPREQRLENKLNKGCWSLAKPAVPAQGSSVSRTLGEGTGPYVEALKVSGLSGHKELKKSPMTAERRVLCCLEREG